MRLEGPDSFWKKGPTVAFRLSLLARDGILPGCRGGEEDASLGAFSKSSPCKCDCVSCVVATFRLKKPCSDCGPFAPLDGLADAVFRVKRGGQWLFCFLFYVRSGRYAAR